MRILSPGPIRPHAPCLLHPHKKEADTSVRCWKDKNTPLHMAVDKEDSYLTELLLTAGAPNGLRDASGMRPSELAASRNLQSLHNMIVSRQV